VDFGGGDLTVLLVYDKSGSMAETWDGRGKWQIASDALLAGIVGVEDKLTIGALLFPQPLDCQVEPLEHSSQIQYMSGRQFVSRWAESVATAAPNGATPMGLAFQMADSAIRGASALGLVEGRRFRVLLVTDGEPNCGTDPESLVAYASMWHELGVETHVLGLPGSQAAASLLDHIAVAGSTGGYVAAGDVEQVEDTFHAAVR
jgi:Mg-chelatase subunit ChlD